MNGALTNPPPAIRILRVVREASGVIVVGPRGVVYAVVPMNVPLKDHRLLDGRAVRDRILEDVAERVRRASVTHTIGRLVSVSIGAHKATAVYVRGQTNAAKKVGLRFE